MKLGSVAIINNKNDESYFSLGNNENSLKISDCYSYQSICKHEFIEKYNEIKYNFQNIGQYKENTITFLINGKYTTISPFNYGEYDNLLII